MGGRRVNPQPKPASPSQIVMILFGCAFAVSILILGFFAAVQAVTA